MELEFASTTVLQYSSALGLARVVFMNGKSQLLNFGGSERGKGFW